MGLVGCNSVAESNRKIVASIRNDLDTVEAYLYARGGLPDWADAYRDAAENH
jgi:hypothetical protein